MGQTGSQLASLFLLCQVAISTEDVGHVDNKTRACWKLSCGAAR